jgi:cellular nucleic acid-binding protein
MENRWQQHVAGEGSEWTKMHRPVKYQILKHDASSWDEDRYVEEYMSKYGIDNVRGGVYSTVELSRDKKRFLQEKIWHSNGFCLLCGGSDHWAKECNALMQTAKQCSRCGRNNHTAEYCYARRDITGANIGDITASIDPVVCVKAVKCTRCGRNSHTLTECYATTHLDGNVLVEDTRVHQTGNWVSDTKSWMPQNCVVM